MKELTPNQIVEELDHFIIGQGRAKQAVAIALRNRWRRQNVTDRVLRDEISPHNILMVGPTGVGKSEIARRIAKISYSPFIKVEATKFTEIGYVGKDVDSIIRDLFEISLKMSRENFCFLIKSKALIKTRLIILNCLIGNEASEKTKNFYLKKFDAGELDNKEIELYIDDNSNNKCNSFSTFDIPGSSGNQMGVINLTDILGKNFNPKKKQLLKFKIKDAVKYLLQKEIDKLIDEKSVIAQAVNITENQGIVFIDEIDKITSKSFTKSSDVNREGVQRDLLPLIEGTTINTKYASIKTNSILFIASGAFHLTTPSDLLPELQGRFPIKVNLNSLSKKDLLNILYKSKNSLPKQYIALFKAENVILEFSNSGLEAIAKYAAYMNNEIEDTGARRLYTLFSKILEKVNFCADKMKGQKLRIDVSFVEQNLNDIALFQNYDKFIL